MIKQEISQRLLSEFNDLKRTIKNISDEMNYPLKDIEKLTSGKFEMDLYTNFLLDFSKQYPVNISDLFFIKKNTTNGVLYFSAEESKKSSRILSRTNKHGEFTPYYEYRDTAKSNISYFYPEWIEQLRVVDDSDPNNEDVVFNNGHLLHQYGLFVGPVNYYYELSGKKYCIEMNTGDTSYISPYIKHTFTSRDPNKQAYIVAVTNGGLVKRNQKEFLDLGLNFLNKSIMPVEDRGKTIRKIIDEACKNELISESNLNTRLKNSNETNKTLSDFYELNKVTTNDLIALSEIINISPGDIVIKQYETKEDVINKFYDESQWEYYPDENNHHARIFRTAETNDKLKNLKGFLINVTGNSQTKFDNCFQFSLNLYIINFGENDVDIHWKYDNKEYKQTIKPSDSISIDPYIEFIFTTTNSNNRLFLVATDTAITLETKKELSFFKDPLKTITDDQQWYKGKKGE